MQFDMGCVFPAHFPQFAKDERGLALNLEKVLNTGIFKAIELGAIRDLSERNKVKNLLKDTGTKCVFLGGGAIISEGLNLSSLDEGARAHAVARLTGLMEDAEDLDAVLFLISSGPDAGEPLREQALAQLGKSVSELCGHAREIASARSRQRCSDVYTMTAIIGVISGAVGSHNDFARTMRADNPELRLTLDQSHLALGERPQPSTLGDTVTHAPCQLPHQRRTFSRSAATSAALRY